MTTVDQRLEDDKMRADIALALEQASKARAETAQLFENVKKIQAETGHIETDRTRLEALTAQAISNLEKMAAEKDELRARTIKLSRESVYSPLIAGAGAAAALMGATAAIVKLFF